MEHVSGQSLDTVIPDRGLPLERAFGVLGTDRIGSMSRTSSATSSYAMRRRVDTRISTEGRTHCDSLSLRVDR